MTSKLATLQDLCTSQNTTIWAYGTGCSQSGTKMHVAAGNTSGSPNYDSNVSNSAYDLTGSYIYCNVTVATGGTGAYTNLTLRSTPSGNGTDLTMAVTNGNLTCNNRSNYYDGSATSVTYNATTMAWWQIIEHNGTVSFQTSPDGQNWTTQRAIPTPSYATSVTVAPSANNTSGTSTDSLWSNFNVQVLNPKVATLADPFTSFDSVLWTQQDSSQISYANAVDIFPASSGFPNIKTVRQYDLTNSSIFARLATPPTGSGVTTEMVLTSSTGGTDLRWTYNAGAGSITASSNVSYVDAGAVTIPYNAALHQFFKISEFQGTMTWWTSPDGVNWTSQRTLATVSYANSVYVVFSAESTSTANVAFDAVGPSSSGHSATTNVSQSWTHVAGTSAGTILVFLTVGFNNTGGNTSLGSFSSVTYNGNAMTLLGTIDSDSLNPAGGGTFIYGINGQASGGSFTVSVSAWTPPSTGTTTFRSFIGASASFTGANSFGTPVTSSGMGTSGSVMVSSTSSHNMVVGSFCSGTGNQSITAGSEFYLLNLNGNSAAGNAEGAYSAGTGSNVTISGAWSNDDWGGIGFEVVSAGGGGTGTTAAWSNLNVPSNVVTVTNPGPQVFTAFFLQINAVDSQPGQTLTYTATGLPVGVAINPQTGVISGNPTIPGTYTVTVTATDTVGASGSATFTLVVNSSTPPPQNIITVTNPGPQVAVVGTAVALHITASDSASAQTLTYGASGLPAGLTISSATGMITGTPTTVSSNTVTVTATDTTGASGSTTFAWTVNQTGPVDVVTVLNPGNQSTTVSVAVALQITATDSVAGQTLTYSASGLPSGLSINSSTGNITGTPTATGTSTATVTATDTTGAKGSTSFTWTINSSGPVNTITVTNPGTQSTASGASVSLSIAASDSASGQTLTYSAVGLPTGLSINSSSGLISGTPSAVGTFASVVVTVKDTTNASGSVTFSWTITAASTITVVNPGPETTVTGTAVNLQIMATDSSGTATGLVNRPTQAFTFAYAGATSGAAAYEFPGALVAVSGENVGASIWQSVAAAGGTVLAYLDPLVITQNGLYHQMLYNSSTCGPAVPPWPPGFDTGSGGNLSDFRVGGVLQSKLACVLQKMISDNPNIGGFFIDDVGTRSWYPNINWATFPDQAGYRAGAIAICQTVRNVCNQYGLIFLVNGTWEAGTLAATGGGYPNMNLHGCSLADGGCVEHHDGQISYFGPYGSSTQWASGSQVTQGTAFNVAVMNTSAGLTEYVNSNDFAFVNVQSDYTVIAPTWGSFHSTGLPTSTAGIHPGSTLTFSATGLPPGLSISSTGLISGTPNVAGNYSPVVVTAKDSSGATGSVSFGWTVNNPTPPPQNTVTVTNPGSHSSQTGTAVSLQIVATDSAASQILTFTANNLPAGLSIGSNSGLITGTPTTAGTYNPVTVIATDSTGASGSAAFSWVISVPSTGGATLPPPSGTNVTVDFRTVANGGPAHIPVDALGVGITISGYSGGGTANITKSSAWLQLLKNLAPGSCRVPMAYFSGNPGAAPGGSPQPGTAIAYITAINSMGAVPYVIYAGDTSDNGGLTGTNGGNFVNYFNSTGGGGHSVGPVHYWIVGNEPDNNNNDPGYNSALAGIISGMHAADSTVVVSAPAAAFWDTSLISGAAAVTGVGCLSYHAYDAGDGAPPGADGFPQTSQYFNNIVTMKGYKSGILYGLEEFNWNFASAGPQNWENTVWMADVIGQTLYAGGHAIMYSDSNGQLGLINDGGPGGNMLGSFLTPQPAYWAVGIWTGMNGQFFRYSSNLVSSSTTFSGNSLNAYGCDNGKIVIVNKDNTAHALTIGMGGKLSGTYNIWATQQGNPSGAIQQVVAEASYSNQVINYTIPAGTAVSVNVS